jgi:cyclopropane fatty-acyl-phospholipid synthase-like methyltransferase
MSNITLAITDTKSRPKRALSRRQIRRLLCQAKPLDALLKAEGHSLKIALGNWSTVLGAAKYSAATPQLEFSSYGTCSMALRSARLYTFAMLFFRGKLTISGALEDVIEVLYSINIRNDARQTIHEKFAFLIFRALKIIAPWFARRFESNFHYSFDAHAYELFLDPYLQYTCGRFLPTTTSLDDAQIEKFRLIRDWVSETIGPLEGKTHLDVGSGWGGLVAYFARHYGTRSTGLTNCAPQAEYAAQRFGTENTILGDFSSLENLEDQFDFVTVIGMSEHVVGPLKDKLLRQIHNRLKDRGVLYFQTIIKPDIWVGGDAYRIAQKLIFPGHDLDTQEECEARFARAGFQISHAADHSWDYARTTHQWGIRLRENFSQFEKIIGLRNASLFMLYLFYASKLFGAGRGRLLRYALVRRTHH